MVDGGLSVGAGWGSAALGRLEYPAEGCGPFPLDRTGAKSDTSCPTQAFALNRLACEACGQLVALSGFWGLDWVTVQRRL